MDYRKLFSDSFDMLKDRTVLFIAGASIIIPIILVIMLLVSTGLWDMAKTNYQVNAQIQEQQLESLQALFTGKELPQLDDSAQEEITQNLATNIIAKWPQLLAGALAIIIIYIYLHTTLLVATTNVVKKKRHDNLASKAVSRMFVFILQSIIQGLIVVGPLIAFGIIIGLLAYLGTGIGVIIAVILLILPVLAIIIYLAIRLVFGQAAVFMDECGPIQAISTTLILTKERKKEAGLFWLCLVGVGFVIGQVSNPFQTALTEMLFSSGATQISAIIVFIITIGLLAAASAFSALLLFNAYKQFGVKNAKA